MVVYSRACLVQPEREGNKTVTCFISYSFITLLGLVYYSLMAGTCIGNSIILSIDLI